MRPQQFTITKKELKRSGFAPLWDEEEWWAQCPPVIEVRVDAEADVVRYCFDFDQDGVFKGSHEDDYYEEGEEAVEAAIKMARRFRKRLEKVESA